MLERCGAEVAYTRHGYECVRKAEEMQAEAALVDETLPDVTAVTVVARLRERPATEDIPVVVAAETADADFDKEGGLPPHVSVLRKPYTAEMLGRALEQALSCGDGSGFEALTAPTEPPPDAVQTAEPLGAVVLLLGPDEDMLEWLEAALSRRKVDCLRLTDIDEALRRAAERPLTAVLADVEGSDDPYARAVRQLRLIGRNAHVPIYAMTGPEGAEGRMPGVTGILTKPFRIQDVMDAVFTRPRPFV